MPQVFTRRADTRLRLALFLLAASAVSAAGFGYVYARSGQAWKVGAPTPQHIPYSHAIHAGQLGLDCRFCHSGVEQAASAGMPTAQTCLGCHEKVWNVSAQFAPLYTALSLGAPVEWSSVHRQPSHARMHHGAHTAAGVACETCHGKVWEMPHTVKAETLNMGWCIDCHRDPAPRQRPVGAVFDRTWQGPAAAPVRQFGLETRARAHEGVDVPALTQCSVCHQ